MTWKCLIVVSNSKKIYHEIMNTIALQIDLGREGGGRSRSFSQCYLICSGFLAQERCGAVGAGVEGVMKNYQRVGAPFL